MSLPIPRPLAVAAAVTIALALTGCYSQGHHPFSTAAPADIVGTWAAEPDAGITFAEDGSFVATSFPKSILCSTVGSGGADGHGTWALEDDHLHSGRSVVYYDWTPDDVADGDSCRTVLFVEKSDGELQLFCWIGDPDDALDVTFTRSG